MFDFFLNNAHLLHWDYVVSLLSLLVLYLRFAPIVGSWGRILLAATQGALFLAQLINIYIKNHPADTKTAPKQLVNEVVDHYLNTHPTGQQISAFTDIDEKIEDDGLQG
jgi:hypothetical protein